MKLIKRGLAGCVALMFVSVCLVGSASAQSPSDLRSCNQHGDDLTMSDGSILVAGTTSAECYSAEATRQVTLVKLRADGSVDGGFSDGGVRILGQGDKDVIALLGASQGGAILVTDNRMLKVLTDGSLDPSFGQNGEVKVATGGPFGSKPITAAAVQDDGKVVLAGGGSHNGLVVARYAEDGQLDASFGSGGLAEPVVPSGHPFYDLRGIGFDDLNRIVVAGDNADGAAAMRLIDDGTLDMTYGAENDGFAVVTNAGPPDLGSYRGTSKLYVDGDGAVRIYGIANQALYIWNNVVSAFDADGLPQDSPRRVIGDGSGVFEETPSGTLLTSNAPGRGEPSTFNVAQAPPGEYSGLPTVLDLSPKSEGVSSISRQTNDGSLLVAGTAEDFRCVPDCTSDIRMAIVRLDGSTGKPADSFGTNGVVIIPEVKCPFGVAPPPAGETAQAWKRCRVSKPRVAARFAFNRGASARPGISGTVRLGNPPLSPGFMGQKITVKLPNKVKLTRRARSRLVTKATSSLPGKVKTSLVGRKITVSYLPDWSNFDSMSEDEPLNGPFRVNFRLKPGAIKPIAKKLRKRPLRFRVGGRYEPVNSTSAFPTYRASKWYGENGRSIVANARPVKRRSR